MFTAKKEQIKESVIKKESNWNNKFNIQLGKYRQQKQAFEEALKLTKANQQYLISKTLDILLPDFDYVLSYNILKSTGNKISYYITFKPGYDIYDQSNNYEFTYFAAIDETGKIEQSLQTETGDVVSINAYLRGAEAIKVLSTINWEQLLIPSAMPISSSMDDVENPLDWKKPNFLREAYQQLFDSALTTGEAVCYENPDYLVTDLVTGEDELITRYVVGKSGSEYYLQTETQKRDKTPFVEVFDLDKIEDISFLRGDFK